MHKYFVTFEWRYSERRLNTLRSPALPYSVAHTVVPLPAETGLMSVANRGNILNFPLAKLQTWSGER